MGALFRIDGAVRYNGEAVPHGQLISGALLAFRLAEAASLAAGITERI